MTPKKTKPQENFFTSSVFLFESWSCISKIERLYPFPNEEIETVKIYADRNAPVHFAFESKAGLVRLNDDGSAAEKNILGKLLSIDNSSIENYFDFFSSNGFLLPISFNSFDTVGSEELRIITNRLRATLELMSTITDMSRTSYEKIVRMILYHIFGPVVEICTQNGSYSFKSRLPSYTSFLESALELKCSEKYSDSFNNQSFTVRDSISEMTVDAELIRKMFCSCPPDDKYGQDTFKRVFLTYFSPREKQSINDLAINDFLFHYFMNVGVVNRVDFDKIHYYRNEVNKEGFTDELRAAALRVAKQIIKDEIEYGLGRVHPSYDTNKLEPAWKIDSLLSALYFGLFYMRPSMETYRRCASPKCGEFFLVSRSSLHKKYCCKACQNREMAARKRARDRERDSIQKW